MASDPMTLTEFQAKLRRLDLYAGSGEAIDMEDAIWADVLRLLAGERARCIDAIRDETRDAVNAGTTPQFVRGPQTAGDIARDALADPTTDGLTFTGLAKHYAAALRRIADSEAMTMPPDYMPEAGWLADDVARATARLKEWGHDMTKPARKVIGNVIDTDKFKGGMLHSERITAILSALTAADYVIERGWQPIETAPTMEAIQVIGGEVTYPVTASWTGRDDEPWCLDALGNVGQEIDPPTHWRPLPEPPAAAEAEAKEPT